MVEDRLIRLRKAADRIRRTAVEMAHDAGAHGSHLGGSLSSVEIYAVLYGEILHVYPGEPLREDRDRMVVGKEHARLSEFPAMAEAGFFGKEALASYLADDGLLAGHPYNPEIGLEFSCCSLGMALPVAVGMAINAKRKGKSYRVYTIMGDGEMDEGLIWEGLMAAAQFRLDNLTAVIDRNSLSCDGETESIMALGDLEAKLRAFGWDAVSVNGHDVEELVRAFETERTVGKPFAIIAHTVKGKGLSFVEGNPLWHQNILTDDMYKAALEELKEAEYAD